MHGKVINYKDIEKIPKRFDFVNKEINDQVNKTINEGKEFLFLPSSVYDIKHMQDFEYAKSTYKLTLFGILESGLNQTVVIDDIYPYFEIRIPDNEENKEEFANDIFNELKMDDYDEYSKVTKSYKSNYWKIEPIKFNIVKGKPLRFFQEEDSYYVQIYFNKLQHRRDAIQYIRAKGYETAHDDLNDYYRVVSRDYMLPLSSWLVVKNYKAKASHRYIKDNVIHVSINNISEYNGKITSHLLKDNTMTMTWDIETCSKIEDGEIPQPENSNHVLFMIGMTFQWYHSDEQLLRICLVDKPMKPHPDFLTIVCEEEKNIIRTFCRCFARMKPEIVMGFNDAGYDWHWVISRAKKYKILHYFNEVNFMKETLDDKTLMKKYQNLRVKIEADLYASGNNLQLIGYIPIDIMIIFRQLYPTSENWSLNYFLNANNLSSKKDMPYKTMFRIYRDMLNTENPSDELLEEMKLVAEYCVFDAQQCHSLMKTRSVLQDRREVSNLSFTSLYDAFYRANGMKVRNLVIARANLRSLKISNINNNNIEQGKYPGAWVFDPKKGLCVSKLSIRERIEKAKLGYNEYKEWLTFSEDDIQECYQFIEKHGVNPEIIPDDLPECFKRMLEEPNGRPITGLDFSSLYPSLMMTYNFSPEYIIEDKTYAENMLAAGHNLHKIKFEFNGRTIRGWSVRHDNKTDTSAPDCKFGIFPSILKELFDTRKKLKSGEKGLAYWEHQKEELLALPTEEFNKPEIKDQYDDACFQYNAIDSKQKALKIFMNTFYGEAGNKCSPLFMLQVAGGVTSMGQYNIKKAYNFIKSKGCDVYYGDTDSIYLAMHNVFQKVDIDYYTEKITKLEYWNKLVELTFENIKPLNKEVNDMFVEDNGTKFLKMAYEESLYPVLFTAKKKYVGLPHVSRPNFDPKVPLFIRGLELKKRGVSELLKDACYDILRKAMSVDNIYTVMELVENKIIEIYNTDWHTPERFRSFIMTGMYKPGKQNIKIVTFRDRMQEERGMEIPPNERFNYVIVKKYPYKYDHRGRKMTLSVGDKMELADIAQQEGMPIDLDHYMANSVNGQLARFITYYKDFYIHPENSEDVAEVRRAEEQTLKLARKYIDTFCEKFYDKYEDRGVFYKAIYKKSNKLIKNNITKIFQDKATKDIIKLLDLDVNPEDNINKVLIDKARDVAEKRKKNFVEEYLKNKTDIKLDEIYLGKDGLLNSAEKLYRERQSVLELRLNKSTDSIKKIFRTNANLIEKITNKCISGLDIDNCSLEMIDDINIDEDEIQETVKSLRENLEELQFIYYNLISNHEYIFKTRSIVKKIQDQRNKKIKNYKAPELRDLINNMVKETVAEHLKHN